MIDHIQVMTQHERMCLAWLDLVAIAWLNIASFNLETLQSEAPFLKARQNHICTIEAILF